MDRNAEMIFSGDELLRGDIVNTNQSYLGQRLLDLGVFATRAVTVSDDLDSMVAAIRDALSRRPEALILSGGLGPTEDDLTREATSEAVGRPLEFHQDLLDKIRDKFAARGFTMTGSNRKQALLPQGAEAIPLAGTAPGFMLDHKGTLIVALPGVPWELKEMWEGTVEARLDSHKAAGDGHTVRRIRTFGIGESIAAERLADLPWRGSDVEIGTRASLEELTIILRGPATPAGARRLDELEAKVRAALGERVFGVDSPGLPEITGDLLRQRGRTVAVAESCTGGLVGKRFTDIPGSSDYFLGGVTAYHNDVKVGVLGVPEEMLVQHGAVSPEVAAAMAEGVRDLLHSDCSLSTTGVAGPGGGTEEKPVGLVYIGSVVDGITELEHLTLWGHRDQIRERAALAAVDLLRRRLLR